LAVEWVLISTAAILRWQLFLRRIGFALNAVAPKHAQKKPIKGKRVHCLHPRQSESVPFESVNVYLIFINR